jgi:hypothetical protein
VEEAGDSLRDGVGKDTDGLSSLMGVGAIKAGARIAILAGLVNVKASIAIPAPREVDAGNSRMEVVATIASLAEWVVPALLSVAGLQSPLHACLHHFRSISP